MYTFQSERDFALAPVELWHKLRDPAFLVGCLPDATLESPAEKDRAVFAVQPNLGFVRGRLDVTLALVEAQEPTLVRWHLSSKGVAASSEVEITMTVAPRDAGSRVQWQAEISQLGGLLRMVPGGLIRGAAQKVIEDVWNTVAAKLGE